MSNISTRVREAHERAKSTITRYRAAVASIDARWTPDNFRPTRYETEQEWQARLAATRASEKVTAEAKFRAEAWRELEGLIGTHRSSVQALEQLLELGLDWRILPSVAARQDEHCHVRSINLGNRRRRSDSEPAHGSDRCRRQSDRLNSVLPVAS